MATTAEAESARSQASAEPDGAAIELSDVQLSVVEPTTNGSEKRLKAQISFELSGMDAQALASRGIPFRMEGCTVDLETGASERVISERSRLVPEVLKYVGQQEFGLPIWAVTSSTVSYFYFHRAKWRHTIAARRYESSLEPELRCDCMCLRDRSANS